MPVRWAIVGPGRIAHAFAKALSSLPNGQLTWVQGRDAARTQAFATQYSVPSQGAVQVTQDLATLLAQADVDAVYVATPHSAHAQAVAACLRAGKAVLCEKPLVPNHAQGAALVALARQHNSFLMEALWTRFLPIYVQVGAWLRDGTIGTLHGVQSSFCFATAYDANSRLFDPALAGGALLDLGVYNLSMTRWVLQQALGACPEPVDVQVQGRLAPTGVDQRVAGTLVFDAGLVAQFMCGFDSQSDNRLSIQGALGHIRVGPNFSRATQAVLTRHGHEPVALNAPLAVNGFEGEIAETIRCLRAGLIESPQMRHADSVATRGWMDKARAQLGVRYPFE